MNRLREIVSERKFRRARLWSNRVLRKYAALFHGEVANVSGWKDSDKAGGFYKDYFINATKYYITNHGTHAENSGNEEQISLDLEKPLPTELSGRFDVVFNHTVLEHVFNIAVAFKDLCELAREAVILVVPFVQVQHSTNSYSDFWRFTPLSIEKLFKRNNYTLVISEHNNHFNAATYLLCIGIRNEALPKYKGTFKKCNLAKKLAPGRWVGINAKDVVKSLIRQAKRVVLKIFMRK